jgi:hypothetical protein
MMRAELLISERDEKLRQIARGFYGGTFAEIIRSPRRRGRVARAAQ